MGAALRALLGAGIVAVLAGCMTPYQPRGFGGGYTQDKLAEDTYRVSFYGNGNTPRGVVLKYFLYRCAELTIEHGYEYFELYATDRRQSFNDNPFVKTAGHARTPTYTYVPGGTITTWSAAAIVRMYPKEILAASPTLFSAHEVVAVLASDVRSGTPNAAVPAKFRSVEGQFPIMPVRRGVASEPPPEAAGAGPVNLDDLKGLMPSR